MTKPTQAQIDAGEYDLKCTNGHDRCYMGTSDDCPYCERVAAAQVGDRDTFYDNFHKDEAERAAAQVGPVPGETLDDLRIIASGLLSDGIDVSKLTNVGRAELRQAIDRILKLANP